MLVLVLCVAGALGSRAEGKGSRRVEGKDEKTHSAQQIVQLPHRAPRSRRYVLPRHARHFDGRLLPLDTDEAFVIEVEIVHGGEDLAGVFGRRS